MSMIDYTKEDPTDQQKIAGLAADLATKMLNNKFLEDLQDLYFKEGDLKENLYKLILELKNEIHSNNKRTI